MTSDFFLMVYVTYKISEYRESLDNNNKVSDFNSRIDSRNNRSSEREITINSDNKKTSSEFYFYKNPDNTIERVELRHKPGLYPDRRVEELRDSQSPRHSPTPERRSRLSSPLLQRRQPGYTGYSSPGQSRKSLEVAVPQVPDNYSSSSLQRPRRVGSGQQRWSGDNANLLQYHSPQVARRSVPIEISSPLLSRHRDHHPPSSPAKAHNTAVLASLDKSILQIR